MKASLLESLRAVGARLLYLPRSFFVLFALAWIGGITYLSAQSLESAPGGPIWRLLGNGVHVPLFGFLALWCALCLPRRAGDRWPRLSRGAQIAVIIFVATNGVIDEWHQSMSGRTPDASDVLTDVVAAVWVVGVASYAGREEAQRDGLRWRLWGGALCCLAAAALASI
ncbi:MAG: hypothetical protein ACI8TQ_000320 [Planctomycetota bacterium]